MSETTLSTAASGVHIENDQFDGFARSVQERFDSVVGAGIPLFTVDAGDLYGIYLDGFLVAAERQHHTCHACRQFIERFGNLVSIDEDGSLKSVVWDLDTAPIHFRDSVGALAHAVRRGKVTGVFIPENKVWGTPVTGEWHHLSITPPASMINKDLLRNAFQVMAARKEDFRTLRHGLADYGKEVVAAALNLIKTESLTRSEKVLGPAQFLFDLHEAIEKTSGARRDNIIWRAVATAPVGWSTPRSSVIGPLLDDIVAGKPVEQIKRSFASMMDPTKYQRPQSAPSAGNIQQAEKIVEQMGIDKSLKRRTARIDEVQKIWEPQRADDAPAGGGVFGHLKPKDTVVAKAINDPVPTAITFVRFARDVLPAAKAIAVRMDRAINFCAFVTAVEADAPPILQWDKLERRNPVSTYVYVNGSVPSQWGLPSSGWVECAGIALQPWMWGADGHYAHMGKSAVLLFEGAKDTRKSGACLFPEILRSELHQVRHTIEAFSKNGVLEDGGEHRAIGLAVGNSKTVNVIRVTSALGDSLYTIDRWE